MESGALVPGEQTNIFWIQHGQIYPYVGSPGRIDVSGSQHGTRE